MSNKPSHLFVSLFIVSLCLASFAHLCSSLPLSVQKRWIVDEETGKRVKLACSHWVAHSKPMLAEGLDKLPLNDIAAKMSEAGFNCVRFSYATYMFTRFANYSVAETLSYFDMPDVVSNIEKNNPEILKMTHLQAYEAVVDALGKHGVMVLIDNHVSMPEWCCSNGDQNGFWGDKHFDPNEWLQGLAFIAKHFKGKPQVFAMDLRNELRGSRQNSVDWYKYVSQGAKTINENNPDLLVIVSGLNFDNDLSFLKTKPLELDFANKVVYEAHIYSFSGDQDRWNLQPVNRICASVIGSLNNQCGFIMSGQNPAPLFISEFGYDMDGGNAVDNKFLPCFASFAASVDLDWSLWAFGGSYYYRQGNVETGESYGVMDYDWKNFRDKNFPQKFQLLQRVVQDPSSNMSKSHLMFHPLTGNCVHANGTTIVLGDCKSNSLWSYEGAGSPIRLMNSAMCLNVAGEGLAATLSEECLPPQSAWKPVSLTGLHLASMDKNGEPLCLERDSDSSKIVTRKCICIDDGDSKCLDNPQSQWFQLISTNV